MQFLWRNALCVLQVREVEMQLREAVARLQVGFADERGESDFVGSCAVREQLVYRVLVEDGEVADE